MKIATFNVNSLRKRLPIVLDWVARQKPDVLCLQETKVQDSEFPLLALAPSGYDISYRGMKSYNGVAVLTDGAHTGAMPGRALRGPGWTGWPD